ncbi:MAG: extracellular solute-binding protein [Candidatus Cloacimonetes bacterium]|nr:extracellular solute-binding protein [Candidatus Cloacimonadota bacterium]
MKNNVLFVLLLCSFSIYFCSCVNQSKSNSIENVVLYANITGIESILDDFEVRTGLHVVYNRVSTTDFLSTIINEHDINNLSADIIQAPITVLNQLSKAGILTPYISSSADDFPDWTKRESEGIYKFAIEYVGIIYNSELISSEEAPQNYQNLTDPQWKDKIVMPDPAVHLTTVSWLVALKEHVFENNSTDWMDFIYGLAANNPMLVTSFTPTASVLLSGEKSIAISMPKYLITNPSDRLNWVKTVPLFGSLRGIGIYANAENPVGAKSFIDYWLSDSVGETLANEVGEYVLTPGIYPPIEGMEQAVVLPIADLSDEETIHWANIFKEIFHKSGE